MKLLSFDIGIKNLAFCVLEKKEECITIVDWGILNVSIDSVCHHCNLKNNNQCDKSAKYKCGELLLCSAHYKLKQYSDKKFTKIPKHKDHMLHQGKQIVKTLQDNPHFLQVDKVVIENQPALKNPTMKTIQMMVYSYFLINGITNSESTIEDIQMINARNKLKAYTGPIIPCDIKDKYKRTKYLGIQYCLAMIIDQTDQWINLFTTSKKKDDLSDAYLQGVYVMNSK